MGSVCTSCGAETPEGARFCPACGTPLRTVCPACGSEQAGSAAFCSSCGAALHAQARRAADVAEHEERRVVTMLFADLAGSTALGESLDPEDVRTVQEELFELVNGEVQRHEGVSEKFVGDAVLAVFGIPRAHEDDADRAVRAALAAQRDGSRIERMLGAIGAPTGPVAQAMHSTARALVDLTGGRADDAARALANAESELRAFGRHYDAACVALEVATALDAAGDEAGAAEARERAPDVLGPLGCVNPW